MKCLDAAASPRSGLALTALRTVPKLPAVCKHVDSVYLLNCSLTI